MSESIKPSDVIKTGYTIALSQVAKLLLQIIGVLVLTRFFSPSDFGALALASLGVVIVELLRDRGTSTLILADRSVGADTIYKLGQVQIFYTLAGWAILLVSGLVLESQGTYAGSLISFSLLGTIPFFSAVQMPCVIQLSRSGNYRAQNISDVAAYFIAIATAITLALFDAGILALLVQPVLAAVLGCFFRLLWAPWPVFRLHRNKATLSFSLRDVYRRANPLLYSNLLSFSAANADVASLGVKSNPFFLGGYARCYQILVGSAGQIMSALAPLALASLGNTKGDPRRILQVCDLFIARLGLPVVVALGLVGPHAQTIIVFAFGAQWSEFTTTFVLLSVVGILQLLTYVSYWFSTIVLSSERVFKLSVWTKIPSILLIIVASFYGVDAVAFALLISNLGFWLVFSLAASRKIGVQSKKFLRSGLTIMTLYASFSCLSLVIKFLSPPNFSELWTLFIGAAAVPALVFVLKRSKFF